MSELYNDNLRVAGIRAIMRAATLVMNHSNALRASLNSPGHLYSPYGAEAYTSAANDCATLRLFAKTFCPHPVPHYSEDSDGNENAHCGLCDKAWTCGEGRESDAA